MAKKTMRGPIPEKIGTSARPWATPIVNGLVIAAVNPAETPTSTMPSPTRESKPSRIAMGTSSRMNGSASSNIPKVAPASPNISITTGMSRMSRPANRREMCAMPASMAFVRARTPNAPPTMKMKKIMGAACTIPAWIATTRSAGVAGELSTAA